MHLSARKMVVPLGNPVLLATRISVSCFVISCLPWVMMPHSMGSTASELVVATAAANSGVPDRLFKRHGRWRSENAKDGYIKDCMASCLAVTKSLRL